MNLHELPMIIFTVLGQMSVGTFIVLGVIQLVAGLRHSSATVDRLTEPVVYAIGPALVLGMAASMLHMNDVFNVFNVFRHAGSSWLSREIIFGVAFAGLGTVFALMQWFKVGSFRLRQVVAAVTALTGIALVWAMSQIYQTLTAVPAWNTPIVPLHFFGTTLILGAIATGCALVATAVIRRGREGRAGGTPPRTDGGSGSGSGSGRVSTMVRSRVREINEPTTATEWQLITRTVQLLAVVTAVVGMLVLISYPVHIADLATDPTGARSAQVFSGAFFVTRLLLLGLASIVLALFGYRTASVAVLERPKGLLTLILAAFVIALIAEFMGRALHYSSFLAVGI